MNYHDGMIWDTEIQILHEFTQVQVIGEIHKMENQKDKFWIKAIPVCDKKAQDLSDGISCNGCTMRCWQKPLFIKFYKGREEVMIAAIKNQGTANLYSPYIARTYGVNQNEDGWYVVMEYVQGQNLKNLLSNPVSREIRYLLMRQMLLCVRDYQKQYRGDGVHLDLKPNNFVVSDWENPEKIRIHLVDFEGYTLTNGSLNTFVISNGYAHPRQLSAFQGNIPIQVEVAWDIYALGAVFYEIIENKPFFTEKEIQEREEDPFSVMKKAELSSLSPNLGEKEQMEALIDRMMNPDSICQDIDEVIAKWREITEELSGRGELELPSEEGYMRAEEKEILSSPNLHLFVTVEAENRPAVRQHYRLYANTCFPLYYGINVCGSQEENNNTLLGFFYEVEGKPYFFPIQGEEEPVLIKKGSEISCEDIKIRVMDVEKNGYMVKKAINI